MSECDGGSRISRTEHRGRGWCARFQVRDKIYRRYFSDATYGSTEAARQAALSFASADQELHDEFLALRRRFEPRKNSRSGLPGLARYDPPGRPAHWLAYYDCPVTERRVSQRFYIGEHGEEQARLLAIEFRENGVRPYRERYEELMSTTIGEAPRETPQLPVSVDIGPSEASDCEGSTLEVPTQPVGRPDEAGAPF
jgi:hypothetical protein